MPPIDEYKCKKCGFTLPEGWGMYFYVVDDKGRRIVCGHPGERRKVEEVLGKKATLELIRERTGFNSDCICLSCLHQFPANLGESGWSPFGDFTAPIGARVRPSKDKRECPKCKSIKVKTVFEMVGETCPKCKEGIIEQIWTGLVS
ncbi:hypothetical protein ACFLU4_02095 [Chloroflexota bacterium]